jgi:hypothetical protein
MPNKYFDMLSGNIDSFGVITQNAADNWDGGDTTQREGMFLCAMWYHLQDKRATDVQWVEMWVRYGQIIDKLNDDNWSLRRHPDPSKWYNDTNRMSRDQLVPNLCALGYCRPYMLKSMIWKHMLRGLLFTTNTRENGATLADAEPIDFWQRIQYFFGWRPGYYVWAWSLPDITDPSIFGAYVRGLEWTALWPTLWLSDWILVVDALITLYKTKQGTVTDDQLTQQMLLLQSAYRMPTWVSKLAMWIYKKCNPQQSLDQYFAPANDGPAMNEIYREIWALQ